MDGLSEATLAVDVVDIFGFQFPEVNYDSSTRHKIAEARLMIEYKEAEARAHHGEADSAARMAEIVAAQVALQQVEAAYMLKRTEYYATLPFTREQMAQAFQEYRRLKEQVSNFQTTNFDTQKKFEKDEAKKLLRGMQQAWYMSTNGRPTDEHEVLSEDSDDDEDGDAAPGQQRLSRNRSRSPFLARKSQSKSPKNVSFKESASKDASKKARLQAFLASELAAQQSSARPKTPEAERVIPTGNLRDLAARFNEQERKELLQDLLADEGKQAAASSSSPADADDPLWKRNTRLYFQSLASQGVVSKNEFLECFDEILNASKQPKEHLSLADIERVINPKLAAAASDNAAKRYRTQKGYGSDSTPASSPNPLLARTAAARDAEFAYCTTDGWGKLGRFRAAPQVLRTNFLGGPADPAHLAGPAESSKMARLISEMSGLNLRSRKISRETLSSGEAMDSAHMATRKSMLHTTASQLQQKYDQFMALVMMYKNRTDIPDDVLCTCNEHVDDIERLNADILALQKELADMNEKKQQYVLQLNALPIFEGTSIDSKKLKLDVPTCGDAINPTSTFRTCHQKMVAFGTEHRFNEANYMEAYGEVLQGKAYDFFNELKDAKKTLPEIIDILKNCYVKDTSKADYRKKLFSFGRRVGENISTCMSRFSILLEHTQTFYPETLRNSRIPFEMKNALLSIVHPDVRRELDRQIAKSELDGTQLNYTYLETQSMILEQLGDSPNEVRPVKICLNAMTTAPGSSTYEPKVETLQAAVFKSRKDSQSPGTATRGS